MPVWSYRVLSLVAAMALTLPAFAQSGSYVLQLEAVSRFGPELTTRVTLDSSAGGDVQGWSFGVLHDAVDANLVSVVDGATSAVVNNGGPPDFNSTNLFPNGWTVGAVVSFGGFAVLAPGAGYELNVAEYTVTGGGPGCIGIDFTDTLGSPPVATVVVVNGNSIAPVQVGLCEEPPPPGTTFVGGTSVEFTGETLAVTHQIADPFGLSSQGFSMALANNPAVAEPIAVFPVGVVAALNEGAGPDFFQEGLYPNGWTVGCVYSFLGLHSIVFDPPQDVVTSIYAILGEGSLDLEFVDGVLGSPPVPNLLVAGGASLGTEGDTAEIEIVPPVLFIRGDCNDDGGVDLADAIFVIARQNPAAYDPALYSIDCTLACDPNDDGGTDLSDAVFLINYRFLGGPPPAAPFPACGTAVGQGPSDCEAFASCP